MRRVRRGGFTFVETVFGTLGVLVLGGALYVLGTTGREVWLRTDADLAGQSRAQAVLDQMVQHLRVASRSQPVQGGQSGPLITFANCTPTPAGSPCSVKFVVDQNNDGIFTTGGGAGSEEMRYWVRTVGNVQQLVWRKNPNTAPTVLVSEVTEFKAVKDATGLVTLTLGVREGLDRQHKRVRTYTASVRPRNP